MKRQWEKAQCSLNFDKGDGKFARHQYNHVVESVTDEQMGAFTGAISSLKEEPLNHALLTQVYRFEPNVEA